MKNEFCGVCGKKLSLPLKAPWQGKIIPVCKKCWYRVTGKMNPTIYYIRLVVGVVVSSVIDLIILWLIAKSLELSLWYPLIGWLIIKLFLWIKRSTIGYLLFLLLLKNPTIDQTWRSLSEHNYPNPTKYGRVVLAEDYFSDAMEDDELAITTRLDAAYTRGVMSTFKRDCLIFDWMMEGMIKKAIEKYHRTHFQGKEYECRKPPFGVQIATIRCLESGVHIGVHGYHFWCPYWCLKAMFLNLTE